MHMEILQDLCGSGALGHTYGSARALPNDKTADWGGQTRYHDSEK